MLVGLMLSLSGGASAFAKGEVIWEGTQESKFLSLTGPKNIRITTEGVFINERFKPARQLSKEDACLYGLSNFPNEGYMNTSEAWDMALNKFDFHSCKLIRLNARYQFKFHSAGNVQPNFSQPVTNDDMQEALDLAKRGEFSKAKSIWERGHQQGNNKATLNLGLMYSKGDGVKKDLQKAFDYYSKASEKGNLEATFRVIDHLHKGIGTTKDIPEMARLVKDAYRQHPNNMKTNEWMGFIHFEGLGVKKNEILARSYLNKAIASGSDWATKFLAEYSNSEARSSQSETTSSVAKNFAEARRLYTNRTDAAVCLGTTYSNVAKAEAKRRGLNCGADQPNPTQVVTNSPTNAELMAAQKRAAELEKQLALLQAKEVLNQRQIASDGQAPLLEIIQSGANGREGYLIGSVTDNVQIAELLVDGKPISVNADGSFNWTGFLPATGKEIVVEAFDTAALSSKQIVRLERSQTLQKGILQFDELDPTSGKSAQSNQNALALIVGISEYDRTNAQAIFADNDAQFFQDYAALKLGIPEKNITTLLNADAGQVDVLLSIRNSLTRAVRQEQSDVYVFFAGHGLASDDGQNMYLLPHDGAPELLEDTTVSRHRLFTDIAAANPRSVTVFLDTCYSGTTRGPDMLIASRPIAIRAKEQAVPDGFTVMTAAAGDQTAKPLEEAKHGMFSYFLMKGMEGDADANQDNQITAGELHAYVQQNVIQQSSGTQTPELQGDADRVLVRFQ